MFNYLAYLEEKTGTLLPVDHPLKKSLLEAQKAHKEEEKRTLRVQEINRRFSVVSSIQLISENYSEASKGLNQLAELGASRELLTTITLFIENFKLIPIDGQEEASKAILSAIKICNVEDILRIVRAYKHDTNCIIRGIVDLSTTKHLPKTQLMNSIVLQLCKPYIRAELAYTVGLLGLKELKPHNITTLPFHTIESLLKGIIQARKDPASDIIACFDFIWKGSYRTEAKKRIYVLINYCVQIYNQELFEWVTANLSVNQIEKATKYIWQNIDSNDLEPKNNTDKEFYKLKSFIQALKEKYPTGYKANIGAPGTAYRLCILYGLAPITPVTSQHTLQAALNIAEASNLPFHLISHITKHLDYTAKRVPAKIIHIKGVPKAEINRAIKGINQQETSEKLISIAAAFRKYVQLDLTNPTPTQKKLLDVVNQLPGEAQILLWYKTISNNYAANTLPLFSSFDYPNSKFAAGLLTAQRSGIPESIIPFILKTLKSEDIRLTPDNGKLNLLKAITAMNITEDPTYQIEEICDICFENLRTTEIRSTFEAIEGQGWLIERLISLEHNKTKISLIAPIITHRSRTSSILEYLTNYPNQLLKILDSDPQYEGVPISNFLNSHIAKYTRHVVTNINFSNLVAKQVLEKLITYFKHDQPLELLSVYNACPTPEVKEALQLGNWEWPSTVTTNEITQPMPMTLITSEHLWVLETLAAKGYNIFTPYKGKTVFDSLEPEVSKGLIEIFVEAHKRNHNGELAELEIGIILG